MKAFNWLPEAIRFALVFAVAFLALPIVLALPFKAIGVWDWIDRLYFTHRALFWLIEYISSVAISVCWFYLCVILIELGDYYGHYRIPEMKPGDPRNDAIDEFTMTQAGKLLFRFVVFPLFYNVLIIRLVLNTPAPWQF